MTGNARHSAPALDVLFRSHATSLLRLAAFLTGDRGAAEELVQDAFVAFARQPRPPRPGAELAYLRRSVVNLSRRRHRHLIVVRRHPGRPDAPARAAEDEAARRHGQSRVADAIHSLPDRQRECMVLRYGEVTDTEIADALGISVESVKTHLHRARAALATVLKDLR
ncbi:MAG: sigma-70 family RNA polymerase sigma factor [Actinomycetota bacterium]|nr:sigma-70 family RNA polymerase sigma factor [Actinomycetota bacterium]